MIIPTLLSFILLLSCQESKVKSKIINKPKTVKVAASKTASIIFDGSYSGTHNQKEIFITLKESPRTNKINGVLVMDGQKAQIIATKNSRKFSGNINEDNTNKTYNITAEMVNKKLHFNITFPEYNNQVLALVLNRSTLTTNDGHNAITIDSGGGTVITSSETSSSPSKNSNRDSALVGTWRFTEVISSGSGQFYTSFSTDYFLQLKSNGECATWTGKSAGGNNDVSIEDNSNSSAEIARWYSVGKNIVFVNPSTNKEMVIPYYAEENRMKLKGNLNRLYIRIN